MNNSVSITPTKQHLEEIKKWLLEERNTTGDGFYCNWSIIENFYNRKELAVLLVDNKPVGFCCWRTTSLYSGQINLFEIQANFRNTGLGIFFTKKIEEFFISQNIFVIDLECEPKNSECFWRKLDFIDVPTNMHYWRNGNTHLFKRLVECQEEVSELKTCNYIEIWDVEPYVATCKESKWKWDISIIGKNKLSLPIIQPCDKDWRIKFVRDGKVVIDNKIKRFGNIVIDHGPYAVITKLPEI